MSMFSLWLSQKRKLSKRGILDTRSGNRCLGVRKKFTYANTWGRDLTHFSLIPRSISVDTVMYFRGGGDRSLYLSLSLSLSFSLSLSLFLSLRRACYLFGCCRTTIFQFYSFQHFHLVRHRPTARWLNNAQQICLPVGIPFFDLGWKTLALLMTGDDYFDSPVAVLLLILFLLFWFPIFKKKSQRKI